MKVCLSLFLLHTYFLPKAVLKYLSRFHFRLYWTYVCWVYLRKLWPVVAPRILYRGANSWFTLKSALTLQQLSSIGWLIKSQGKPIEIFCLVILVYYWFCSPKRQLLKQHCSLQKANRLRQFVFSGCISLASAVKYNLIDSPLVSDKWLSLLANKWATWKFTLDAVLFLCLWRNSVWWYNLLEF